MPSTIIDEYKIFPRIMMTVVTILTYQAVHWYMSLPPDFENITAAAHETGGQTWATESLHKYNTKIEAYCVPQFLTNRYETKEPRSNTS